MLEFLGNVWRKNWAGKATLLGGGLVLLLALAGTIYGVAARPGDLKFMEREGRELRWDRADVPVDCFHLSELPDAYAAAYAAARRTLAGAAGGALLGPCVPWRLEAPPSRAPDGSVLLRLRDSSGTAHGAETRHRFDRRTGRILSATVALDRGLPADLLDRVVLHELGHVLGLAHDREESSVMFPAARGRPKALSTRDAAALRAAYLE
jgi:Matrixin